MELTRNQGPLEVMPELCPSGHINCWVRTAVGSAVLGSVFSGPAGLSPCGLPPRAERPDLASEGVSVDSDIQACS